MKKVTVYCDVCGREVTNRVESGVQYWYLQVGEDDSFGGFEDGLETDYDVCSKECLYKKLDEYMNETKGQCNDKVVHIGNMRAYEKCV